MKVSGRTKLIGIFGDPVAQTLSPYMHNAAFESMGLDLVYAAFRVKSEHLKDAVSSIRALEMPGVNITIPHKIKVMSLLDEVDKEALEIGAVNTVVNKNGKLVGHNTDGRGYLLSLRNETGFHPEGKHIVVVGAGGAARAIAFSLLSHRPKTLIIANRTLSKAAELTGELAAKFKETEVKVCGIEDIRLLKDADLLINTTSIGMAGKEAGAHPTLDEMKSSAVVSDIVYRPLDTPLIKAAVQKKLVVHKGLGMLIHQGALSFELWTGKTAPVDTMRFAAIQAMEVS